MNLRGIEFGPIIDTPKLRGKKLVRYGAGVALVETFGTMQDFTHFVREGSFVYATDPFFIFLSLTGTTSEARLSELREAISLIRNSRERFPAPFALVISIGSSATSEDASAYVQEFSVLIKEASTVDVPLVAEVSLLAAPETAADIMRDPNVEALFVSDSILWTDLPPRAQKVFFRRSTSPFSTRGGGRVFGKYLSPLVVEWVAQLRRQFVQKPIITGAGVLRPRDVDALKAVGASAITLTAARLIRPWNIFRITLRAKRVFLKRVE
jgi:hypothetical protein